MLVPGNAAHIFGLISVCIQQQRGKWDKPNMKCSLLLFKTTWLSQQGWIQWQMSSLLYSVQFVDMLGFKVVPFVVGTIWLQLVHSLQMCSKMTLYNYSIISPYSMHGSDKGSFENKNVFKLQSGCFVFLEEMAFNQSFPISNRNLFYCCPKPSSWLCY